MIELVCTHPSSVGRRYLKVEAIIALLVELVPLLKQRSEKSPEMEPEQRYQGVLSKYMGTR